MLNNSSSTAYEAVSSSSPGSVYEQLSGAVLRIGVKSDTQTHLKQLLNQTQESIREDLVLFLNHFTDSEDGNK